MVTPGVVMPALPLVVWRSGQYADNKPIEESNPHVIMGLAKTQGSRPNHRENSNVVASHAVWDACGPKLDSHAQAS